MALFFNWKQIKDRDHGLTFDDVLILPSKSEVRSRKDPSLRSKLTKTKFLETPIISANMDTVTESKMAIAMHKMGGLGILHRFMTTEQQVEKVRAVKEAGAQIISASIGVNADFKERAESLVKAGVNLMTIDIAHGHSVQMMETLKWLKDKFSGLEVIAEIGRAHV